MKSIKMAAAALAGLVLAGCATPPAPPIATHTFVILTTGDDAARNDKATEAALRAHASWLPQYGDLRRMAVEAIVQRLTHDLPGWRMAPAVDVNLLAIAGARHDEGTPFVDEWGVPRPEIAELRKRLDVDAVFVVTERTLAKGPFVVGNVELYGGNLMGWEQVTIASFDRTRPPSKEADSVSLGDRIIETTTPEARAAMLADCEKSRHLLEELLSERGH